MNESSLREVVLGVLADVAPAAHPGELVPRQASRDQMELDSPDYLSSVLALERRLGVKVAVTGYPRRASFDGALGCQLARLAGTGTAAGGERPEPSRAPGA